MEKIKIQVVKINQWSVGEQKYRYYTGTIKEEDTNNVRKVGFIFSPLTKKEVLANVQGLSIVYSFLDESITIDSLIEGQEYEVECLNTGTPKDDIVFVTRIED